MPSTRELCEARQIPVTGLSSRYWYVAAVCDERDFPQWSSAPLTALDVEMIRSYIEYTIGRMYNHGETFDGFVKRWSGPAAPCAAISGHNTITFLKRADDDWGYSRYTWTSGPPFFPQPTSGHGPKLGLPALLDHVCGYGSLDKPEPDKKWEAWKAAHPEVFGAKK